MQNFRSELCGFCLLLTNMCFGEYYADANFGFSNGLMYGGAITTVVNAHQVSVFGEYTQEFTFSQPGRDNATVGILVGKDMLRTRAYIEPAIGVGITKIMEQGRLLESYWIGSRYENVDHFTASLPVQLGIGYRFRFFAGGILFRGNINPVRNYCSAMLCLSGGKMGG